MVQLKTNTAYHNSWNMFSRVFLVANSLKSKNLIVFDNKDELKTFSKIWNYLWYKKLFEVEDISQIINFYNTDFWVYVTTKEIFELSHLSNYDIDKNTLEIIRWNSYNIDEIVKNLIDFSFKFSNHLSSFGSYNREWDIINIRPVLENITIKISFFWDEVDEILIVDNETWEYKKSSKYRLSPKILEIKESKKNILNNIWEIVKYFNNTQIFLISLDFWEWIEIIDKTFSPIILRDTPNNYSLDLEIENILLSNIDELINLLKSWDKITIYTKNSKTLTNFIEYNNISWDIEIIEVPASMRYLKSFKTENNLFICDDILSDIFIKKRSRKSVAKNIDLLLEIKSWDYIVHIDHWVGIFKQIILKDLSWIKREYIEVEYKWNDKLFVPISELHRISKYIGKDNPELTGLNSTQWQKIIKSTEVEVERIAKELLEIYAKRSIVKWYSFASFDYEEEVFRKSFPYIYTLDQETCIREILADMEKWEPMDRLLVWDVWFGKTEVAMNAIYRCFLNKKQTVFISPLVILAYEHHESLKKRFANFWVKVEILTRVSTPKEESIILKKLALGEIDCIIWTHRLLSPDIKFKNLWLIIIDEEHRFWVIDKEKLNKIKSNIDILSLSATPIPRSLNFALNGIKDISIISTPPPKKKPIKTLVAKWSDELITKSIDNELEKGWQVLFIHNRVATIEATKNYLEKLLGKKAKIITVNGQMNGIEVEDRIIDFRNKKYNILLSTTVIENWVNFHNANTIIIDSADTFWLSQLHQLRWRVGRWVEESSCYLIYRKENVPDDAKKRLITIVNNSHLWAWFEIAMRDLEIRWAWDILWIKQSGKSKETWLSLYLKLLEEKIEELKTWNKNVWINCQIELNISYYISEDFFNTEADKIHFFRNIESIETLEDLDFTYKTFVEWNDIIPEELNNLFLILKTRIILANYSVESLKKVWQSYIFELNKNTKVELIKEFLDKFDIEGNFVLINVHKIKVATEFYSNDKYFMKNIIDSYINR